MGVVRAAAQREIGHARRTAPRKRDDGMELQAAWGRGSARCRDDDALGVGGWK